MITVKEAEQIIMNHPMQLGETHVSLSNATGRILNQDIIADRDFPPFDRVTMDGIAIAHEPYKLGQRAFRIIDIGAAGSPQTTLSNVEGCIEIMTGAILPIGTDTVIRYEDLKIIDGVVHILDETIQLGKNVHKQGTDKVKGELLVSKGVKITAAEIGIAATVGCTELNVLSTPKICLISTGDELVAVNELPKQHQIRTSNMHSVASALGHAGFKCDLQHLPDDKSIIKKQLTDIIDNYDIIVLSGGVSKGKFDFIPDALTELGVTRHFHKVKQRPGKPFWFGSFGESCFVFALPGNPVSTLMCAVRYLIPWVRFSQGLPERRQYVELTSDVAFKPDMTYMLHGLLSSNSNGVSVFAPVHGKGSGDLASLTESNGFIELVRGQDVYETGGVWRFFGW